jgi:hypothetical protein
LTAENEQIFKNEQALFMSADESEIGNLRYKQEQEIAEQKTVQEQKISDM